VNPSRIPDQSEDPLATRFDALGDPARLAILRRLQQETRCVCELVPSLGMPQSLLSYHLRVLREAGLVEGYRRGRRIEYRLRHEAIRDLAAELGALASGGRRDR